MTTNEARMKAVCRVCGLVCSVSLGQPQGWYQEFRERVFPPPAVTLNFGDEYAHTACLSPPPRDDTQHAE